MVLAQRAGLDLQQVVDLVGPGAGGSRMFQMRAPMIVSAVYEPATMRVSTWKKDMAIIGAFATGLPDAAIQPDSAHLRRSDGNGPWR